MNRIYLDANATTPVLPQVVEAMSPFWSETFGNPSSAHRSGQRARGAVEQARASIARMLNCSPKEIVFTSGGTESDNLALNGVLCPFLDARQPAHLITTEIEHHAVLFTAQSLQHRGVEVTTLAPNREGIIDPAAFEAALRPDTKLVSIMFANNETGAIQPIGKLARITKAYNPAIVFHTDAVQAAAKLPLDLGSQDLGGALKNVDLLSLSGHKMYAPQGTGVLFVRAGLHLAPILHGGPQERQRRAGTENVPGIVALG
ncbi:MAG: cysteine desulfurase family protein, partial [Acidobacteriaceae bacterium]